MYIIAQMLININICRQELVMYILITSMKNNPEIIKLPFIEALDIWRKDIHEARRDALVYPRSLYVDASEFSAADKHIWNSIIYGVFNEWEYIDMNEWFIINSAAFEECVTEAEAELSEYLKTRVQ